MSVADKLGMGPTRTERFREFDHMWEITITPPEWSGFKGSTLHLTQEQYEKYILWCSGKILIQDAFPNISADQREQLMSGISPSEWNKAFKNG